jgi:uncharacterized protein YggE
MTKDNVTTIGARGFVVAEYDTAKFTLTFSEYAPKARDAKLKLKKGVEKVSAAIESLRAKGLVTLGNSFHTSTSVQPNTVYNNNTHKHVVDGQKATYTVVFQTPTLDLVSEAYDVLSELDVKECTINSPTFFVRNVATLKQQALEDAWKVAQVLFTNQCRTLGIEEKNFAVSSWAVNYSGEDYSGFSKGRNMSNSSIANGGGMDDDGAIELVSGKALVEVILTVNYSRKAL